MKKLERINAEKLRAELTKLAPVKTSQALSDESIKVELLKTKSMPLVSWKEKVTYLSSQVDKNQVETIQTFDIFT